MNTRDLYTDIAERTGGDIYIGVVGPVRTGKSTFIKRAMDLLVLPNIQDPNAKQRATDELPQSGDGRQVMTTQPKFVPNEAVAISLADPMKLKMRMVDCVGYLIDGAQGADEDGNARMVRTPWFEHDIPFEQAAELGTRKVIADHSTIGVVVTADGSFSDFPRSAYEPAEERVVGELKALGKPFAILVNSAQPASKQAQELQEQLQAKYQVPVVVDDAQNMQLQGLNQIMESILYEFPLTEVLIQLPAWMTALGKDHQVATEVMSRINDAAAKMSKMRDFDQLKQTLEQSDFVREAQLTGAEPSTGSMTVKMSPPDGLFYSVLSEASGEEVQGEEHLMKLMCELVSAKREYDRVSDALQSVRTTGYGLVPPEMSELMLEQPELVKTGSRFGVKLKASAPSLHLIRVDIQTEVNPIVGTEQQSEEMVQYLMSGFEKDPDSIWDSNMFGKSLNELVKEGLSNKLMKMPDDVRGKVRGTLEKIINDGNGGMICILL